LDDFSEAFASFLGRHIGGKGLQAFREVKDFLHAGGVREKLE
jgi:hypothetical protein